MKKLFGTMAVAAALFAGYSAYEAQNSVNLNDVALANVEALADAEIIIAEPCMYVPYNSCIYLWDDDGSVDFFEGVFLD